MKCILFLLLQSIENANVTGISYPLRGTINNDAPHIQTMSIDDVYDAAASIIPRNYDLAMYEKTQPTLRRITLVKGKPLLIQQNEQRDNLEFLTSISPNTAISLKTAYSKNAQQGLSSSIAELRQ